MIHRALPEMEGTTVSAFARLPHERAALRFSIRDKSISLRIMRAGYKNRQENIAVRRVWEP